MRIEKGYIVAPKTSAGLELADTPVDGSYRQIRKTVGVLRGLAIVIDIDDVIIDYDDWPTSRCDGLGKVEFRNCKVQTEDGIEGWAGEGALVVKDKMKNLKTRLDDVINQINPRLFGFELKMKCKDIGLDPKDVTLVAAIIRAYKKAEWTVKLNARDNTLIFT